MGSLMDFMKDNSILLFEVLAVILITTGIAMIYLPLAFICGGIGILIMTHAKENVERNDYSRAE